VRRSHRDFTQVEGINFVDITPKNYQKHLWTEASRAGLDWYVYLCISSFYLDTKSDICGGENNFPDPIIPNSATSKKESSGEIF
jgi:hypothetical protein